MSCRFTQGDIVRTLPLPPHHEMVYDLEMDGNVGKDGVVFQACDASQEGSLVIIVRGQEGEPIFYSWPEEYCRPSTSAEIEESGLGD